MSKEESVIIKGVAIILMLYLHLFSKANISELCHPLLYINNTPLVYLLSRAASPVAFFIILSGYGFGYLYNAGRLSFFSQINRLLKLYTTYWVILAIFVSIGCFIRPEMYPGNFGKIISNITSWSCTYNYETWFLFPYAAISLTAYPIIKLENKIGIYPSLVISFIISFSSNYITSRYIAVYHLYDTILAHILTYFSFFFCFTLGAVLFRLSLKHEIRKRVLKENPMLVIILLSLLIFIRCLFASGVFHSIYVFVFIFLFLHLSLNNATKVLLTTLGKYSMPIWMTHSFFCYYLFPDFIYDFKYPIVIWMVLLTISLIVSIPIMKMSTYLYRLLQLREHRN